MFSKFVKIVPNVFTKVIEATLVIILLYNEIHIRLLDKMEETHQFSWFKFVAVWWLAYFQFHLYSSSMNTGFLPR